MFELNEIELSNSIHAFNRHYKRVEPYINERRKLTENLTLREDYKKDLVESYNQIVLLLTPFSLVSVSNHEIAVNRIKPITRKLKAAFDALLLSYQWDNLDISLIRVNEIKGIESGKVSTQAVPGVPPQGVNEPIDSFPSTSSNLNVHSANVQGVQTEHTNQQFDQKQSIDKQIEEIPSDLTTIAANSTANLSTDSFLSTNSTNNSDISDKSDVEEEDNSHSYTIEQDTLNQIERTFESLSLQDTMAPEPQTKQDFMRLAGPILNYKFNGDPLKLETFLTDIELVEAMAEEAQKELCFKYIKSKLEGRALEAMPDNLATVQQITDALKDKIKPDSSRVVEGKMASLRLIKGNFTAFSKQAEDLAEALRRSLIVEGISKKKAEEMSINKTIEICRKTARSDVVKSVISSTSYATPTEVIAKFITESDLARTEKREQENFKNKKDKKYPNNKFNKFNKDGKFNNHNSSQKYDKNKKFNKNGKQYNNNQNQSQNIRCIQGNAGVPSDDGHSSNNPDQVYLLHQ